MNAVSINEIFYSIQGEGFYTGTPAIFLRTAGCNLACEFCDTEFSFREKISIEGVMERIRRFPCRFIVLTGGEPTLQSEALRPLIKRLRAEGYYIALETNGTSTDTLGVNWITVSPKISQGGKWLLKTGDELKLIFEGQDLSLYEKESFTHYFLQPKEIRTEPWGGGERDSAKTRLEWDATVKAAQRNPRWKVSFQIHKELGLP